MRRRVAGGYELRNGHTVGFKLAGYDDHRRLTIDPSLVYSTYFGACDACDFVNTSGIALDSSGNAYVTGSNGYAFVSKLNSSGSALVYSTYLGGGSADYGVGIALDSSGNAYVAGSTDSSNFPTTAGAFQTTLAGGGDAFVSKLNSSGSLVYSTYLGGSVNDGGRGIALDSSRNAYVTGFTDSSNFPTTPGAFQTTLAGGGDAFVSKLNRALDQIHRGDIQSIF